MLVFENQPHSNIGITSYAISIFTSTLSNHEFLVQADVFSQAIGRKDASFEYIPRNDLG